MVDLIDQGRRTIRTARRARRENRISRVLQQGAAGVHNAAAFAHLHPFSLTFASILTDPDEALSLNLVMPGVRPNAIFAGVRTAFEFGCGLAQELQLPLRVITLGRVPTAEQADQLRAYLRSELGHHGELEILTAGNMVNRPLNPADLWVATHSVTAHALDVATRLGTIQPSQVQYLVQDYEPGFHPWSSDYALTRSTYHAGFGMVVNSVPLQHYLESVEQITVDPARVFSPQVDLPRLRAAADARRRSPHPRIFFYARPSKPRNLYQIGLATLYLVADDLHARGIDATFVSAGEAHPDVILSPRHTLRSCGKLPWTDYFAALSESDVVLSLQHSPHPSHPPLDAVTSGAFAVTNEFAGTRAGLHERLLVAEADPTALAAQVLRAAELAVRQDSPGFDPTLVQRFGTPLDQVVSVLAGALTPLNSPVITTAR